mgnify:CR=1 FL=1
MKLGKRLKHARKHRGLKQQELSALASTDKAKISQAAISALESRNSESSGDLFAFARALRINPEWLQTGEGESGLDSEAWKPAPDLPQDECELLRNYRTASKMWRLSLLLLSRLRDNPAQEEMAEAMNMLLAKLTMETARRATGPSTLTDPKKNHSQ